MPPVTAVAVTRARPLSHVVQDEILDALAAAHPHPLTCSALFQLCPSATASQKISEMLNLLRKNGSVELGQIQERNGAAAAHTYRLAPCEVRARKLPDADAARLIAHLEQDLTQADSEQKPADTVQSALDSEHWDTAAQSHNGDECDLAARQTAAYQAVLQDPVIRAIHRMPELPRIQEARMHADRLAAVVGRLDAGMPILPDPDVIAWLRDQHDFFMEHAA